MGSRKIAGCGIFREIMCGYEFEAVGPWRAIADERAWAVVRSRDEMHGATAIVDPSPRQGESE